MTEGERSPAYVAAREQLDQAAINLGIDFAQSVTRSTDAARLAAKEVLEQSQKHYEGKLDAYEAVIAREARIEALREVGCAGCGRTVGHFVSGKRICACSISTIQCTRCHLLAEAEKGADDVCM